MARGEGSKKIRRRDGWFELRIKIASERSGRTSLMGAGLELRKGEQLTSLMLLFLDCCEEIILSVEGLLDDHKFKEAEDCLLKALTAARRSRIPFLEIRATQGLATLRGLQGNRESEKEFLSKAWDRAMEVDDRRAAGHLAMRLGEMALEEREFKSASAHLHNAVKLQADSEDVLGLALTIARLASMAVRSRRFEFAARLFGAAKTLIHKSGNSTVKTVLVRHEGDLNIIRERLGQSRLEIALNQGAKMTLKEVVVYVSRGRGPRMRVSEGKAPTQTEAQALELVAKGLTSAEIGERLYISKRTVEGHVASALRKLGLSSRKEFRRAANPE